MARAIVLLSGGIDSATALYWAIKQGYDVRAVTFIFHGRPRKEVEAARRVAERAGADCVEVPLPFLRTASDIRKEVYGAYSGVEVPEGFIPTRNLIFYAIATYFAEVFDAEAIIGGHLATDSEGFPDATPRFFFAVEELVNGSRIVGDSGSRHGISLTLPFLRMEKADVIRLAVELDVPFELTWSCYYDAEKSCGGCVPCRERADAFERAGLNDHLSR